MKTKGNTCQVPNSVPMVLNKRSILLLYKITSKESGRHIKQFFILPNLSFLFFNTSNLILAIDPCNNSNRSNSNNSSLLPFPYSIQSLLMIPLLTILLYDIAIATFKQIRTRLTESDSSPHPTLTY